MHGCAAAVEEHGEGFRGQVDVQVEHGGQDLVGEGEPGRASSPGVSFCGLSAYKRTCTTSYG